MSIKGKIEIDQGEFLGLKATVSITATVGEWKQLSSWLQENSKYPLWQFDQAITETVGGLLKSYEGAITPSGGGNEN